MSSVPEPDSDDAQLEHLLRGSRMHEDAPEPLVRQALDLWQPRTAPRSPVAGALRRVLASLVFDSAGTAPVALGLRSGTLATRQLLFSVDDRDIDVRIESAGGGLWLISGQVLGPDQSGEAEYLANGAVAQHVTWSELAEFRFAPVPAGACRIVLRSNDWFTELDIDDPSALR